MTSMGDGPLRRVLSWSVRQSTATGSAYVTVTLDCGHYRTELVGAYPTLVVAPEWHCHRCGEQKKDTP